MHNSSSATFRHDINGFICKSLISRMILSCLAVINSWQAENVSSVYPSCMYSPTLWFRGTKWYCGAKMATGVPCGARAAADGLFGFIRLPHVKPQHPWCVYSDLCPLFSEYRTEEAHVELSGAGGVCCHSCPSPLGPSSLHPILLSLKAEALTTDCSSFMSSWLWGPVLTGAGLSTGTACSLPAAECLMASLQWRWLGQSMGRWHCPNIGLDP